MESDTLHHAIIIDYVEKLAQQGHLVDLIDTLIGIYVQRI